MEPVGYFQTAVGLLKLLPEVVEVTRDVWKKLKEPEGFPASKGVQGVYDDTYYSDKYKFAISVPDLENWRFWEPSPQFVASLGSLFAMPTRDMPIMILSKDIVKLYRPNVSVVIEDVGSWPSIRDIVEYTKELSLMQGLAVGDDDIHISESTNSAVLVTAQPYARGTTLYRVVKMHIYKGIGYYVAAEYVPMSEESKGLSGGMQEIMNSFELIR